MLSLLFTVHTLNVGGFPVKITIYTVLPKIFDLQIYNFISLLVYNLQAQMAFIVITIYKFLGLFIYILQSNYGPNLQSTFRPHPPLIFWSNNFVLHTLLALILWPIYEINYLIWTTKNRQELLQLYMHIV